MPVPDTGYLHETQYQNPGFRTGVRQFCRSQYFVWSQYILFMFYRFLNQNLPKSLDPKKETQEFRSTMLSKMYDSVGKYIVLNMYSNSVRVHYQCIVNIGVLYANVDGGLHFFISMEGGWRSPNDPPPPLYTPLSVANLFPLLWTISLFRKKKTTFVLYPTVLYPTAIKIMLAFFINNCSNFIPIHDFTGN